MPFTSLGSLTPCRRCGDCAGPFPPSPPPPPPPHNLLWTSTLSPGVRKAGLRMGLSRWSYAVLRWELQWMLMPQGALADCKTFRLHGCQVASASCRAYQLGSPQCATQILVHATVERVRVQQVSLHQAA